ncbi:transcriptional regulator GutM [Paenibacillus ginsengihumi]|mgnify:CR=1 FL=1|uniref:transcriptional regulator GutM n=1 Tax=Paenibacillus ginsengihumi TaxID=431596 RepID=UPI000380051C|nr:transcriptional regulator GutM [Paenibacillus ginsengihumi]
MQWWNTAILLFIVAWFLQIALSYVQSKHYQQTVRAMSGQGSGFLGVGVAKRKLGIGSVVILVTDLSGVVTQAKELTGVTVFGRFKQASDFVGKTIHELEQFNLDKSRFHAAKNAVEQIKQQTQNR